MGAPAVGAIVDGYRFKGGDPNNQASWESAEASWGQGARFQPDGSVARIGPRGGMTVLAKAPKEQPGQRMPTEADLARERDTLSAIETASRDNDGFGEQGTIGKWMSYVPGTKAYNLDKNLDTIRARNSFGELQAMRAASPTGGALGSITERELELLQSAVANLDIGQSGKQMDDNLTRVRAAIVKRTPGLSVENPIDISVGAQNIPEGAYWRDAQGNVWQQKKGAGAAKPKPGPLPAATPQGPRNYKTPFGTATVTVVGN